LKRNYLRPLAFVQVYEAGQIEVATHRHCGGDLKMRYLKYMLLLLALVALPAVHSQAQVSFGVSIGPNYGIYNAPPVCEYGFYQSYPFDCAPYGYYGPDYFVNGVFIGVGPWSNFYYSHAGFYRPFYFNRGFGFREGFRGGFGGERFRGGEVRGFRGEGFRGGQTFRGGEHFRGGETFRGGEVRGNTFRGGESFRGNGFRGNNARSFAGNRSFNGGGRSFNGSGSHGYSGGSHNSGGGSYHGGSSHGSSSHGGESHGGHR
jgi:hypothetical protein